LGVIINLLYLPMKATETEQRLKSIKAGHHRAELMSAGVFDGRYRQRVVQDKRFKKPKHKLKLFKESFV